LFGVLAGETFTRKPASDLKVGIARRHFFDDLDPQFAAALDTAVKEIEVLVADMTEVDVVGAEVATYGVSLVLLPHMAELLKEDLLSRPQQFQPETQRLLELGREMSDQDRANGEAARSSVTRAFDAVFSSVDVVLTPTVPGPPPLVDEVARHLTNRDPDMSYLPKTGPMNLAGVPSLTLPVGLTSDGWPIGLLLTAARGRDDLVLDLGEAIEEALGARYADRVAQPRLPNSAPKRNLGAETSANESLSPETTRVVS
ncbi:MAG TPA: amidase family protein, partial [Actinomycetota bacterium]|nr:amidase family protein [Actinomycetota bacterium]